MENFSFESFKSDLKKILKSNKVTYCKLAEEMDMSEASIKKMLNGTDLSFNKIARILSICNVKIDDFFNSLDCNKPKELELTDKQSKFFLKNKNYWQFFYQLRRNGFDWKELKKKHKLTKESCEKYLLKLDKLGLIELHEGNKIKSEFIYSNSLSIGRELGEAVLREENLNLLKYIMDYDDEDHEVKRMLGSGQIKMSKKTAQDFVQATKDLSNEFYMRARREELVTHASELSTYGFINGLCNSEDREPLKIINI